MNNNTNNRYYANSESYKMSERTHKGMKVIEYKPVRDNKAQTEHNEYITRRCIEILKRYNQI